MALLLEIAQIESVIVNLIVCAGAVFSVATFELQQEYDVFVQHNHVHALAHPWDRVFEYHPPVQSAQLILQNLISISQVLLCWIVVSAEMSFEWIMPRISAVERRVKSVIVDE